MIRGESMTVSEWYEMVPHACIQSSNGTMSPMQECIAARLHFQPTPLETVRVTRVPDTAKDDVVVH